MEEGVRNLKRKYINNFAEKDLQKELGITRNNINIWNEVVTSEYEKIWNEELKKSKDFFKKEVNKKGKGKLLEKDDGDDDDDDDGDDSSSDEKEDKDSKEIRTCTMTLKQILRPDFMSNYDQFVMIADEKQRNLTNVMQEISILARKTVTITVSGSIYSGSNIDLGIKPTDPTTFNINNLLPDDFTFCDNDISPILSVAPIPPKLQEYLEQFINKEKTGNDDFVSLLSQDHLQFLHSRFLGILQDSDKTKENEKHPIWSIITQKIKDTSDVNNLFK